MWTPELLHLSHQAGDRLGARGWLLATAESCTGGGLAALITEVPGSSRWFDRGFVTYSNRSKEQMLGVKRQTLQNFGAVSQEVVEEMVQGALNQSDAQVAVAISGVAGPVGGSAEKPVGTVWLAWGAKTVWVESRCFHFSGDRQQVRLLALEEALLGLLKRTD